MGKLTLVDEYDYKITTYMKGTRYFIDIVEWGQFVEAWLYRNDIGVKMMMWGEDLDVMGHTVDDFVRTVDANVREYIKQYERDYC